MPANFDALIKPRGIAIVGASANPTTIGGQPLRFLTEFGYAGKVYPVNPKYPELKGLPCYPDLAAVPKPCDVALIAVAAPHVPGVIRQCGHAGIPFAVVMSAGFREIGEAGMGLQRELEAALAGSSVRMVGPNCIGYLNLADHIHCGFGGAMSNASMRAGRLAMVTQSGGFGLGVVGLADQQGVGFNYVISTGNETDVSALELIAYLQEREDVDAVVAYLEGSTDGRRLLAIGERALELGKPVLMWKVGNSGAGRRAATSHTGRLTAGYEMFKRAIDAGGFIEIGDVDDLLDVVQLLNAKRLPRGSRSVVLTLSGGAGVLLADLCEQHGIELPPPSEALTTRIKPLAPDFASLGNPLDLTPAGYADGFAAYARMIGEVLASDEYDHALVRSAPGAQSAGWARAFVDIWHKTDKPVAVMWGSGSERTQEGPRLMDAAGVPSFVSPRRAVWALAAMVDFSRKIDRHRARRERSSARAIGRQPLDLPATGRALSESDSKAILARYGIGSVGERRMTLAQVEALDAAPLPFPLVVKIDSADIAHKTEAGAVRLGIGTVAELKSATREIVRSAQAYAPAAHIAGVLVQQTASGQELIVGALDDPYFGPVVMVGLGGIFAEVLEDVSHRFAPFDRDAAHEMLRELKAYRVLTGYRGKPAADVDALAALLERLSLLIADHADRIAEIDINPVFVGARGQGAIAADALIVTKG